MAKNEQVLVIEPQHELRFKGPFNVPSTSYMKLSNPSEKVVLFKIKTTAPKKYCVRPNSGTLEPNSATEIAICLQPFIFDPAEKNKHKFMVQTVFAPDGDYQFEQLWKDINPEQLMDSKLKCVFELPPELNEVPAEEPHKVSPKPSVPTTAAFVPSANSTGVDSELEKAAAEVQKLREEQSCLRQENLRLTEEVLRLRHSVAGAQPQLSKYQPPAMQQQGISVFLLALGVGMVVLGVIIGKYVF